MSGHRMTVACMYARHHDCSGTSTRSATSGGPCACICHLPACSVQAPDPTPCPHDAWTGDEGPAATSRGWWPTRWSCDGCGIVADERPVCLSCARTYPGQPLERSFPAIARVCHVCGRTTLLGYAVPKGAPIRDPDPTPCPECLLGDCGYCLGRIWDRDGYVDCPCAGAGHG